MIAQRCRQPRQPRTGMRSYCGFMLRACCRPILAQCPPVNGTNATTDPHACTTRTAPSGICISGGSSTTHIYLPLASKVHIAAVLKNRQWVYTVAHAQMSVMEQANSNQRAEGAGKGFLVIRAVMRTFVRDHIHELAQKCHGGHIRVTRDGSLGQVDQACLAKHTAYDTGTGLL